MAVDFTRIAAADLVRLLNSTRLGDKSHIHLLRYAVWLAERLAAREAEREREESMAKNEDNQSPKRGPKRTRSQRDYERRKNREGQRQDEMSAEGRDIGGIPPVVNPTRRAECDGKFRLFCERYFPERFNMAWSDDHLKVIGYIETAVLYGGLFAMAMPRGSGKSVLSEVAAIWAALTGRHSMLSLIGATACMAQEMLASIKTELENNERLLEDYPEVCYPVRCLEGITNRCAGQTCHGQRTLISWTKNYIILPSVQIPDPAGGTNADGSPAMVVSPASSVIVKVGGLTGGGIRGQRHTRPDGMVARPTFVMLDDPQTDKTAKSLKENHNREMLLQGAVLGMAGPGRKISGVMACTVIQPGDMADKILDRDKHPAWNGVRAKLVYAWPTNEKLWDEYARLRAEGLRAGDGGREATEFYRTNRLPMDIGAAVGWSARFNADELSALQHAMNLRLDRGDAAFFAEFQNEPIAEATDQEFATVDQIAAKQNGLDKGAMPTACQHVALFIDVHDKLLFWLLVAWEDCFTGYIIDYGTHPDQQKRYFTLRTAKRTLGRAAPGAGRDGAIYAGLKALCDQLLARTFTRDDGALFKVEYACVDSGWETETVYKFVREYGSPILFPSKGVPVTARTRPWEEAAKKQGQRNGDNWRLVALPGKARGRLLLINKNHWMTFVQRRLATAQGDSGCLSLWGRKRADGQPASIDLHRMLAEHATSAKRVQTSGHGRTLDEWTDLPGHDVHWLDCLVGCSVVASMAGCQAISKALSATVAKSSVGAEGPKAATPAKASQFNSRQSVTYI